MKTRHKDLKRGARQSLPPKPAIPASPVLEHQLREAMVLHQAGRLQDAETLYHQILQAQPQHLDALYLLGVMACQVGQFNDALDFTDRALRIRSDVAEVHSTRGDALSGLNRFDEAIESYDRAIALQPGLAQAYANRGNALKSIGQTSASLDSFERAICIQPNLVEAHFNRGLTLHSLENYSAAADCFERAVFLQPDFALAHANRGISLHALKRYQAAIDSLESAILLYPDLPEAYLNLGNALLEVGKPHAALASFDRAVQLKPDYAEAHNNRANACNALQQYQAALDALDQALLLRPNFAQAYNTRAGTLLGLRQYREALEACDTAIQIDPHYAEAHSNRGSALCRLQQTGAAMDSLERAIRLNPELAEAHNSRSVALLEKHQYQTAIESLDQAIRLKPDLAPAHSNRGMVLFRLRQYRAAMDSFTRALELDPTSDYSLSSHLYAKRFLCDWTDDEADRIKLEAAIERGEKVANPFAFLGMSDSPALHQKAAEIYIADQCALQAERTLAHAPKGSRIRIGYYSADFYNHATSYLMAELFERHDRSRFEIFGFSFGPEAQDAMRERVAKAMDRFIDVRELTDREVAQLSRELGIDIAIDLKGLTQDSRPGIFAERAADLQLNYLGYPGTMGARFMDYLLADPILIPVPSRKHYTEKIVYLPDSYQANDSTRVIAEGSCSRAKEGLPQNGFVFCCFNINWKITPRIFDLWMRIMHRVEDSLLWLLQDNAEVVNNLRREANSRGVDPNRLVFAERLPPDRHLARHRLADLFLDTFPCNAHTTASDALWTGLPVLTYAGESFASRVGASLLHAIALPELITTSEAAYEDLAVELALHPERLRELHQKLARNRLTTPLFDTPRFTRHLEAAYIAMLARQQAGLAPDHLEIDPMVL